MTRKLLLSAAALAVLSTPAFAESPIVTPYVGIDLGRSVYSYKSEDLGGGATINYDDLLGGKFNNINLHAGTRVGKYFGAELGYFRTNESKGSIAAAEINPALTALGLPTVTGDAPTKVKAHGFSLDALGFVPLTDDARAELIGTAGVTWTKAKFEALGVADDASELGFRVGGGAQYYLTNNISARGLVRYQTADFDDTAEHAWTYSLGVNYSF